MKKLYLRIDENSMVATYKQQEEKRSSQKETVTWSTNASTCHVSAFPPLTTSCPCPDLHQPCTHALGAIPSQQLKDPTRQQPLLLSSAWLVFPLHSCVSIPQDYGITSPFLISLQLVSWLHFIQLPEKRCALLLPCRLLHVFL